MITINFHFTSLIVGLVIGFVLGITVSLVGLYGERWDAGFSQGWKCGKQYVERKHEGEL